MPHCFGYRARTRDLFCKAFRKHGVIGLSRYLINYKKGDYVDLIADGSVTKGMPHKFYHGKTGRVFNVTKHAVGVIVTKKVNGRIIPKRLHVRIEHVRKSACREKFLERARANDAKKAEAKKSGVKINTKRQPAAPRTAHVIDVSKTSIEYMNAIKFRELY